MPVRPASTCNVRRDVRRTSGAAGLRRSFALALLVLVSAASYSAAGYAQTGGDGAIQGTVTDPTGAVVPTATVTAIDVATGIATSRPTSSGGLYNISPLLPGIYTIDIKAPGFEEYRQQNIVIDALHVTGLNLTLKIGNQSEVVDVSAAPPSLETTNATLGGTIESSVYQELPLLVSGNQQRDITQFSNLLPGAQLNPGGRSSIIGGTEQRLGEVYLDGLPLTTISQQGDNRTIFNAVPLEAIDQIKVVTSGFSAEYQGAGLENYTLKSGTNKYHGTVADYIRNTLFDTWGFSAPWQTITNPDGTKGLANATPNQFGHISKPVDHQNEFTFSLGGPIIIPHLFNGRNKLFYQGTYDRAHTRSSPAYGSDTLPTALMQQGNFCELEDAAHGGCGVSSGVNTAPNTVIYDPTTLNCPTATTCTRKAFAGNIIPTAEQSPITQNLQKFLPPLLNANLSGNYIGGIPQGYNNYLWESRVDYDLSERQRFAVSFANGRRTAVPYTSGTANLPVPYLNSTLSSVVGTFADFEYSFTLTPHLVNQFLAGYDYFGGPPVRNITEGVSQYEATTLGITGLPAGQAANEFPASSFTGGSNTPTAWGGPATSKTASHTYDLVDNLQWVKGSHALTFGIQLQDLMENIGTTSPSTNLTLSWSLNETAQVSNASYASNTGLPYASFLLGAVNANGSSSAAVQALSDIGQRFHTVAPYVQDDWKVNSKLTVNIGLRWDYLPSYQESQNRFSFLNATLANPLVPGAIGTFQFGGNYGGSTVSCGCSSPVDNYYKNYGPRVGFAYAADPKTVFRGAFAILYTHGGPTGGSNSTPGTLGFTTPNNFTANGAGPAANPVFYLNNSTYFQGILKSNTQFGGPAGVITTPVPPSAASQALNLGNYVNAAGAFVSAGAAPGYPDPYRGGKTPTLNFFNFGFQRSLTNDITFTLNYAGTVSHNLAGAAGIRGVQSGEVNPVYLALGTLLTKPATSANITAAQAIIPGCCASPYPGFLAAAGTTAGSGQATIAQGLKWKPQYASTADPYGLYSANAAYQSLQASLAIRPTHGLTFNINYTWSKEVDDAGTIRTGFAIPAAQILSHKAWAADRIDRSISTIESPQNIAAFGVYKLPFGKGHIGSNHFAVRALAGGWELSSIATYSSGYPLTLSSSACTSSSLPNQGTCMPDLNPNFTGPIMNGKWGQGITALTLGTKSYVNGYVSSTTPGNGVNSVGAATPCGTSTGPFCNSGNYMIGDAPRTGAFGLRSPGNFRLTSGLRRTFDITEHAKFIFGVDCQNVTNSVTFGVNAGNLQIGTNINSSSFGTLGYASTDSRDFQFSGRIQF